MTMNKLLVLAGFTAFVGGFGITAWRRGSA